MLSKKTQDIVIVALANRVAGKEVSAAINAALPAVPAAHVANVTTANATDLASAIALANANKVTTNAILAALQAAGLML